MNDFMIPPYIAWQRMDDYIYVFDEKNKKLFFLKELSIDIWENIVQFKTLEEITVSIMEKYECSDEKFARETVCDFVGSLKEEDILYAK